jgi:hypothetical protein
MGLLAAGGQAAGPPTDAGKQLISPVSLSEQATLLITRTVAEWPRHELEDGRLVDPVIGPVLSSYGSAMTGQAMVEVGAAGVGPASGPANEALIADGLRAEVSQTSRSNQGGFELLALAEGFTWNERHLASNPAWKAARGAIAEFLRAHGPLVSSDAGLCYSSADCYDNLKLVAGLADLALVSTGLTSPAPASLLHNRAGLRRKALGFLAQAAANTGTDARRVGERVSFGDAGILSDPTKNPLAYHALSTMMLGHALVSLGRTTPARARAAFFRSARTLVGLMAPDGNVAYVGRGQGQVWTVAATVDALAIAASRTNSPTWRGRYLVGAALAIRRLQAVYPVGSWGLALVPRLAGEPGGNYEGIDGYANSVSYNGLALWALVDATRALTAVPATVVQPLPATTNGVFLDPSHTKFATVTNGSLWFAIHGTDSDPADARYDFGLAAAEKRDGSGWRTVLPYRPLTFRPTTGGPALLVGGRALFPIGRRITAKRSGEVVIRGGWGTPGRVAPRVRFGTIWTYRATPALDGVTLTFRGRPHRTYQFEVWYALGSQVTASSAGLSVVEPGGFLRSYSFNSPVSVSALTETYHSAYSSNLASALITLRAPNRPHRITYTTTF